MSDVLILCYHAVSPSWPAGLAVLPDEFDRQIRTLVDRGYVGTTFHTAVHSPPDSKTFAVTFDDAYRSVYSLARPILDKHRTPATVFTPTAHVDVDGPMSWAGIDRWLGGPHESELVPMTWQQLGELAAGGWEIASHTRTHPHLPELSDDDLHAELADSKAECERRLGQQCRSLAYPYGALDDRVVRATRAAGYTAAGALADDPHGETSLSVKRIGIYRKDRDPRFKLKISPAVRRLRETRIWRLRDLIPRSE